MQYICSQVCFVPKVWSLDLVVTKLWEQIHFNKNLLKKPTNTYQNCKLYSSFALMLSEHLQKRKKKTVDNNSVQKDTTSRDLNWKEILTVNCSVQVSKHAVYLSDSAMRRRSSFCCLSRSNLAKILESSRLDRSGCSLSLTKWPPM